MNGQKPIVVLLHGVWRTPLAMAWMGLSLHEAGFQVVNLSYGWHSRALPQIGRDLYRRLQRYKDREMNFVTHSYGGLVARHLLNCYSMPHVRRVVMLGPPNRGSCIAHFNHHHEVLGPVFRVAYGKSALNLTPKAVEDLPAPPCEFGIIAGGTGKKKGYAPFLPGDNDGVVTVRETRLPGMKDFLVLPHKHTFIMNGRDTIQQTIHFLRKGRFHKSRRKNSLASKKNPS